VIASTSFPMARRKSCVRIMAVRSHLLYLVHENIRRDGTAQSNDAQRYGTLLESLDVLSIHRREFCVLAANLPALRESFEQVIKQRRKATESVLLELAG